MYMYMHLHTCTCTCMLHTVPVRAINIRKPTSKREQRLRSDFCIENNNTYTFCNMKSTTCTCTTRTCNLGFQE